MLSPPSALSKRTPLAALALAAISLSTVPLGTSQEKKDPAAVVPPYAQSESSSPEQELQNAIDEAANDRAALARNLETYLRKYPETSQRPQIYRALVEANVQLHDTARAAEYAERIVALTPDDVSANLLAVQLLERAGDEAALRRAVNYASRVLDVVERNSTAGKSPRVSPAEWEKEKKRDRMSLLSIRARLERKLQDTSAARKDFEASYALLPTAGSAEQLGEIAELDQDLNRAISEYARAFALAETQDGSAGRREIRRKLGNVWRLAHGSEDGLGDFLLRVYDEINQNAAGAPSRKNPSAKEPFEFTLRSASGEAPYLLAGLKGKILVIDFWATWCGPCRALAPHFDRLAAEFQHNHDVLFLAADCDEDETLVPAYLKEEKLKTPIVFADGLDGLLHVNTFPTLIVLDRAGKIAYRGEGFDPGTVDQELSAAVLRALTVETTKQ